MNDHKLAHNYVDYNPAVDKLTPSLALFSSTDRQNDGSGPRGIRRLLVALSHLFHSSVSFAGDNKR